MATSARTAWPSASNPALFRSRETRVFGGRQPLDVDLGTDYDVVLVPNFLHHFNASDCVWFLKRAHAALRPGGRVAIVEFVSNPGRVTPPQAAGFSLIMLATTPEGDAYTFEEYSSMLAEAGFQRPTAHQLPASVNQAILAVR